VLYWIAAPYIFAVLFPAYMNAVFYSQLYMVGLIFFPGISLFALYFQLMQQTATQYKLSIIGNVVTIVLGVILIARYGALGAVLENTLSWSILLLINLAFFIVRGYRLKKV
jgi:O-antigen/teichoic acid export membrane protein